MSLAKYADPVEVIRALADLGTRTRRVDTAPDGDTADRIALLLRQGAQRGIYPQWSLRKEVGVVFDREHLDEIATQIEEGFTAGQEPLPWRLDHYA